MLRLWATLIAFFVLAAGGEYERALSTARSYIELGRIERALDLAEAAARRSPERPEAYIVWGRALASQNQLAPSAEKYERARALGSRDRQLFVELSSVYDVSRAYDKAIAVYRDWLEKSPDDAEMQQQLGLSLLLSGRAKEAVPSLRRACALEPDDLQVRQDLGYALLRSHDLAGASSELEKVLAKEPNRAEALRLLAETRAAQGRLRDALSFADRALLNDAKDTRARRVRARLRQVMGDAKGALADYQALLSGRPDDGPALLGAAGALLALERPGEAVPLIEQARAKLGDDPDVRFREAQLAWRRGERSALTTLRQLADHFPRPDEVWAELERAARKLQDKKLAAEAKRHLGP
jgi:tetratricopeptide (TPR) repeat protein